MNKVIIILLTIFAFGFTRPNESDTPSSKLAGVPFEKGIPYYLKIETIKKGIVLEAEDPNLFVTGFVVTYVPKTGELHARSVIGNKLTYADANFLGTMKMEDIILIENVAAVSNDSKESKHLKGIVIRAIDLNKIY